MMILKILDELSSNASRLHKEAVLNREINNADLKEAFRLAYDPYTQFFIRKIPIYSPKGRDDLAEGMRRLGLLSSRTLTGNAGIEHLRLILESMSESDSYVISRIIGKDLRCGVSEATINKIWPGLVPEYPVMLASVYDDKLIEKMHWPAMVQLKMDGMRFNAIVKDNKCEFKTRNGRTIDLLGELEKDFIYLANGVDTVFDGELTCHNPDDGSIMDRKTGNGILNKAVKGTIPLSEAKLVHATLWDVIKLEDFEAGFSAMAYGYRFDWLTSQILTDRIHVVEYSYAANLDEAKTKFQEYFSNGFEGIILKDTTAPWENKRSKSLIKFKGELECDLKVVGWEEGTGKNVGKLGALVCESADGVIQVNVGSGFNDNDRNTIKAEAVVGKIIAVKYNARIKNKAEGSTESLFLPIFLEIREDKTEADSSKEIK
jgi:ATP-dependent DNA ligase